MLRTFVEDCEIHGVKQLVKPDSSRLNAVCWVLIILMSTVCFVTLVSFRVMYYLTYPYITITRVVEDSYPTPSVALCATIPAHGPPRLPVSTWQNQSALTDQEAVEYAWLHYKINISTVDDQTGEFVLDEKSSLIIRNSTSNITSYKEIDKIVFSDVTLRQSIPLEEVNAVVQRLKLINTSFRVRITADNFYQNYGIQMDDVTCIRMQGYRPVHDCTSQMFRRFTEIGSCIVLDTTTTLQTRPDLVQFTSKLIRQNWADYFYIEIDTDKFEESEWDLAALFFTNGGYPSWNYQSVDTFVLEGISPGGIYVTKFEETHKLGSPYREKECLPESESFCILKCWADSSNCSIINYKDNFGYLPCPLPQQMWWDTKSILPKGLEKCANICANPCYVPRFYLKETLVHYRNDSFKFSIAASTSMTHVIATEDPLYTYDALLSKVGGTLGLFIGASVITVVYSVQFVISLIVDKCINCVKFACGMDHRKY